jgi:hypothetical protein
MKPWHIRKPELLEQLKRDLCGAFSNLHVSLENDQVFVRGSFPIVHNGRTLDRYSIEIELLHDYPDSVPLVREIGGRIARTQDHHVNEAQGDICLFVREERWRVYPPGASFLDFLNVPVHNYFLGESLVELGEARPFGERSHGIAGIIEYYAEELETNDLDIIIRFVECLSKESMPGHHPCPCGSGKKLRQCHQFKLWDLQGKIPPTVARESLRHLTRHKGLMRSS